MIRGLELSYLASVFLRGSVTSIRTVGFALGILELIFAVGFLIHRPWLKIYIATELLLLSASLFWIGNLLIAGGGHAFERSDALVPLTVVFFFSAIPLYLAVYASRVRANSVSPIVSNK